MKKGISLVALIITIIVLIILTAAVIWSSGDTPEQTKLAVFYNDITVVQEAVTTKMLTNYVDDAISSLGEASSVNKWKNILSSDTITGKAVNTASGVATLYQFKAGAGTVLGVGLKDAEMAEYSVDPATGTVYYTRGIYAKLGNSNSIIYNRSLSVVASEVGDAVQITSYVRGQNAKTDFTGTGANDFEGTSTASTASASASQE